MYMPTHTFLLIWITRWKHARGQILEEKGFMCLCLKCVKICLKLKSFTSFFTIMHMLLTKLNKKYAFHPRSKETKRTVEITRNYKRKINQNN